MSELVRRRRRGGGEDDRGGESKGEKEVRGEGE